MGYSFSIMNFQKYSQIFHQIFGNTSFIGMESSILINYSTNMCPSDQGTRVECVCVCVCCMDLQAST